MGECGIGIEDIMYDYLTCEDLHLTSVVRMADIISDDLNQDVFENVVLRYMI